MEGSNSEMPIGVLNTSICTQNTGDFIIMESAQRVIDEVFDERQHLHFPTHEKMSSYGRKLQKQIALNIACGTNLLHSHMSLIKQWNIGIKEYFSLSPVVLLGVGWRSQKKYTPDFYTKALLRKVLSSHFIHSVRDSYALQQLQNAGIENVVNTGCHTTWTFTQEHCTQIPEAKAENVIFTFTDYSKNVELDVKTLNFLIANYKKVYVWCQGTGDFAYLNELGMLNKVSLIGSSLGAYKRLLADPMLSLDYVGTRLHGGIMALQYKRRTLILGVDHRANEMRGDINLPVLSRYEDFSEIEKAVLDHSPMNIKIKSKEIAQWKSQFI